MVTTSLLFLQGVTHDAGSLALRSSVSQAVAAFHRSQTLPSRRAGAKRDAGQEWPTGPGSNQLVLPRKRRGIGYPPLRPQWRAWPAIRRPWQAFGWFAARGMG
jgi:hypothetical protein